MKTFVISDTHFGHKNIIRLANRPFNSLEEMDSKLIENWNSVVGNDDTVIFNGDFMWYKNDTGIFNSLNGKEKILIRGNHDPLVTLNLGWSSVHDILEFNHNGKHVVMCHYPMESWNKKFHGAIHLYGHTHNEHPDVMLKLKNRYNICVECINYTPKLLSDFTG